MSILYLILTISHDLESRHEDNIILTLFLTSVCWYYKGFSLPDTWKTVWQKT